MKARKVSQPSLTSQNSQISQASRSSEASKESRDSQPASIALHEQLASKGRQAHQYQKGGRRQPKGFIATAVGLLKSPRKAGPNSEEHNWEECL
jgi:hypothetical protein